MNSGTFDYNWLFSVWDAERAQQVSALRLLRVRRGMERRGLRRRRGRASRAAGGGVEDFSGVEFNEKRDEFDRL